MDFFIDYLDPDWTISRPVSRLRRSRRRRRATIYEDNWGVPDRTRDKLPGSIWIEDTDLHWVDENGNEWYFNGSLFVDLQSVGGGVKEDPIPEYLPACQGRGNRRLRSFSENWKTFGYTVSFAALPALFQESFTPPRRVRRGLDWWGPLRDKPDEFMLDSEFRSRGRRRTFMETWDAGQALHLEPGFPGSIWIEQDDLHYIDAFSDERRIVGMVVAAQPSAKPGSLWIEPVIHLLSWITENTGNEIKAHTDVAHSDVPHSDKPGNPHQDVPHGDHTDGVPHSDHTDNVPHSDVPHGDHTDNPHGDHNDGTHLDHSDSHFDLHLDHTDGIHQDNHFDHNDGTHSDAGHGDIPHSDAPHADHTDAGNHSDHTDQHTDAHGDHTDSISHVDMPIFIGSQQ